MSDVTATHTLLWYLSGDRRLSAPTLNALDGALDSRGIVYISAISVVETVFLTEKNRIPVGALDRLYALLDDTESGLRVVPVTLDIIKAMQSIPRDIVPEMPDRLIAGTTLSHQLSLITRDTKIQASQVLTIW